MGRLFTGRLGIGRWAGGGFAAADRLRGVGRESVGRLVSATASGVDWAGAGLGRALLSALVEAARLRGLREMTGFVLAQNDAMLRLAARLGFEVTDIRDRGAAVTA